MCSRRNCTPTFISSTASSALRPLKGSPAACAGTPENYDGPFAIAYDSEAKKLKVKAGYLTRNGEFLPVPDAELEPQNGTVCVKTVLEGGEWSEPEILFESPSQFCYPVGHVVKTGDGENIGVSVCSYRVPVAVILALMLAACTRTPDGEDASSAPDAPAAPPAPPPCVAPPGAAPE